MVYILLSPNYGNIIPKITHLTGENTKHIKIIGKLDEYRFWSIIAVLTPRIQVKYLILTLCNSKDYACSLFPNIISFWYLIIILYASTELF